MSDHKSGYDDVFDNSAFALTRATSARSRPKAWPRSASEMRKHVSYGGQGIDRLSDGDAYYNYKMSTAKGEQSTGKKEEAKPVKSKMQSGYVLPSKVQLVACEGGDVSACSRQKFTPRAIDARAVPPPLTFEQLAALRNLQWKVQRGAMNAAAYRSQMAARSAETAAKKKMLMDGRDHSWQSTSSA